MDPNAEVVYAPLTDHAIKIKADQHAANLFPVIEQLQQQGITSLEGIAEALNKEA